MAELVLSVALTVPSQPETTIRALTEGRLELPSLVAVQRMVRARRGASRAGRARARGWLPRLRARVGSDLDVDVREAGTRTVTEAQGIGVEVVAQWDLRELLFSPYELGDRRLQRIEARGNRSDVARATELYVERVELALALRRAPSPQLRLRALRVDGLLSALTDGGYRLRSSGP
jgi:hypothetical protein